jgi:hypothetical protein
MESIANQFARTAPLVCGIEVSNKRRIKQCPLNIK